MRPPYYSNVYNSMQSPSEVAHHVFFQNTLCIINSICIRNVARQNMVGLYYDEIICSLSFEIMMGILRRMKLINLIICINLLTANEFAIITSFCVNLISRSHHFLVPEYFTHNIVRSIFILQKIFD